MRELRFIERDEHSLVLGDDAGTRYRLVVDEAVLAETRAASRSASKSTQNRVSPRTIQSMLRAGKSRDEILSETGAEPSDIERYEGPILAEFAHFLESARGVPVRVDDANEEVQLTFGEVIDDRLDQLGASNISWSSWRDGERGWMVKLTFSSHRVDHSAVWSFEHRKLLLTPETTDAVNLSKQGEVGDRLIPTLRAVDSPAPEHRFDSDVFEGLPDETLRNDDETLETETRSEDTPAKDDDSEYERRQEIEQRAIATETPAQEDLGETADLLEALRKRRGARLQSSEEMSAAERQSRANHPVSMSSRSSEADADRETPVQTEDARDREGARETPKRGRTGIPSWDEILFGTRSEEDQD